MDPDNLVLLMLFQVIIECLASVFREEWLAQLILWIFF